jgi:hypothetical protein
MTLGTQRFVINQNIERFRRLLAAGNDDLARTIILSLLATEESNIAKLDEQEETTQVPAERRARDG